MIIGRFRKTVDEVKRYRVDYAEWLDAGEYLSSVVVTATPTSPTPITFVVGALGANPTTVDYFVTGGASGVLYKATVKATTTVGQIKEDRVLHEVRNLS